MATDNIVLSESDKKLRELILYIALKCQSHTFFGAIKLNKMLFYSDFIVYLMRGSSITDQEYFAIQEGPAPRRLVPVRDKMRSDGDLVIQNVPLFGANGVYVQDRPIALRLPDLNSLFSPDEITVVDRVIERFCDHTGKEASDESHDFIGWEVAGFKETIPYEMAMLDADHILGLPRPALTKEQILHAQSLRKEAEVALADG